MILNSPASPLGLVVTLSLGLSGPRRKALAAEKRIVPPSINIRALVDTGATVSAIELAYVAKLGLSSIGYAHVQSALEGIETVQRYDVSVEIPHAKGVKKFDAVSVVALALEGKGYSMLLGLDLLASGLLVYNGPGRSFSLAF